ncbi:MAG: type IV pilin-like G/H family protein [Cyanobacteriota bacterium]|nr:type IV pilin-like G/H family protein [Cyanobacteriota bacterium]
MLRISVPCLSVAGLVGCLGIWTGFSQLPPALASEAPLLAQMQPEQEIAPLLGEWSFTEEGESLGLIFGEDNRVFFLFPDGEGSAIAVQMEYEVNSQTQPFQLDIIASPEETALTIFEFTPDGKLRLDLDVEPGDPRPEMLGDNSLVFDRVSDAMVPPETMQVIELSEAMSSEEQPPSTAAQFIAILLRAQQAYYIENGEFAADVEQLGLATTLETQEYLYEIQTEGNRSETIAIAAVPKDDGLSSYAGAVFAIVSSGETVTVAGICQSDSPSALPPVPLSFSTQASKIQCPAGSSLLE